VRQVTKHAELFFGVANPHSNLATNETLDQLLWTIVARQLTADATLRALAHRDALDEKRSSHALFIALAQNDAAWFKDNAAELSRANPTRTKALLDASSLTRLGVATSNAIKAAAPAQRRTATDSPR
jgi:hypothetical protein